MVRLFVGEESNKEIIFLHKTMDRLIEKIRKDFPSPKYLREKVLLWCPLFNYIAEQVGISSMLQRDNNDSDFFLDSLMDQIRNSEHLSKEDLDQLCDRFIRKVATSYGRSKNELYIMVLKYSQVIDSLKSKLGPSREAMMECRKGVKERRVEHTRIIMGKQK